MTKNNKNNLQQKVNAEYLQDDARLYENQKTGVRLILKKSSSLLLEKEGGILLSKDGVTYFELYVVEQKDGERTDTKNGWIQEELFYAQDCHHNKSYVISVTKEYGTRDNRRDKVELDGQLLSPLNTPRQVKVVTLPQEISRPSETGAALYKSAAGQYILMEDWSHFWYSSDGEKFSALKVEMERAGRGEFSGTVDNAEKGLRGKLKQKDRKMVVAGTTFRQVENPVQLTFARKLVQRAAYWLFRHPDGRSICVTYDKNRYLDTTMKLFIGTNGVLKEVRITEIATFGCGHEIIVHTELGRLCVIQEDNSVPSWIDVAYQETPLQRLSLKNFEVTETQRKVTLTELTSLEETTTSNTVDPVNKRQTFEPGKQMVLQPDQGIYLRPIGGNKESCLATFKVDSKAVALTFLEEPFAPVVLSPDIFTTKGFPLTKLVEIAGKDGSVITLARKKNGVEQKTPVFRFVSVDLEAKTITVELDRDIEAFDPET